MLFNSIEFLIFLPIVFFLYWFVFRERKWQNFLIVVASYIFYGWWDWRFLLLIAFTSVCSFFSGLLLDYYEKNRLIKKTISIGNIIINLFILCIFKYFNFFVENIDYLFRALGLHLDWVTINVILPVGISFYTFQALSYSIDVYRKKIKATHDIVEFFAYICFFPQLVAGPIERATNLLPQFQESRKFQYEKAVDGCRQILWGLFKKIVIADNCANIVNSYWDTYPELTGMSLLLIGIFFAFQIYGDFSGYSDIAIGCARLFGFNLMRNFNYPYFSRSIPEFWRNWHISLMTWFRDYIYFPLGGSRCSRWKVIRNTLVVFFVSGLWHGANWTFIIWGLYHSILISLFIILGINTKKVNAVANAKLFPSFKEFGEMIFTFFFVVIGWIVFRSENISESIDYISRMFLTIFEYSSIKYGTFFAISCASMILVEWIQRNKQHALQFNISEQKGISRIIPYLVDYVVIFAIIIFGNFQGNQFIYFQF